MNWGLIGASTIASQFMINAIRAQQGHEVKSVFSSSQKRGLEYAKEHEIPFAVNDLEEMLTDESVSVVYISTTNEKHCFQALAAIAAGKHVVCEKPLALTSKDALQMVVAAEDAGVILATNHHLRNAGSHQKIKEIIKSGKIGEVQSIRISHAVSLPESLKGWRIDSPSAGGGVIPDIVVHDADTVRFYLEEDPKQVVAIEQYGDGGVEESVMSIWSMPSGVMVQTHESFTHKYASMGVEICGTEGSILARDVITQKPIGSIELHDAEGSHQIGFSSHDLYEYSMNKFVGALSGSGKPSATGIDGVKSLAVAEAVKKAAISGQIVSVDYQGK